MDYKFENTEGGQLLERYRKEIMECIEVPNSWLPEEFHDDVRGCRTLARLEEMCETLKEAKTEHQKLKALKAENCENYRKQYEANERFEYNGHCDEMQLNRNQMAFVSGMVNSGMIDAEDLEEE